jgi:hypothetical protein
MPHCDPQNNYLLKKPSVADFELVNLLFLSAGLHSNLPPCYCRFLLSFERKAGIGHNGPHAQPAHFPQDQRSFPSIGRRHSDVQSSDHLSRNHSRRRGTAPKLIPLPGRLARVDPSTLPWQQNIRRVGQSTMTEHDPAVMNIEEWAAYWHSAGADIVFISVTGILAFYPSKVQFHLHGKFLSARDFFGECVAAARKRGMRVVARMSPDLHWGDALESHPE